MTTWLFDLGNSRLKCAALQADGRAGPVVAIDHRHADLSAELARVLPARIDVAHVASVASEPLRVQLMQALVDRSTRLCLARTQRRFDGVRIAYAQPGRLGVDRFLALLGAHADGPGAALVCGVGTALTLDLLDADGVHRGGRIAPSPTLMREALHARAAQLPASGGQYRVFADDTDDALASGCEGAALALIEDSRRAAGDALGALPRLLLHGGGAPSLLARLENANCVPSLVLDGLARWAAADIAA